MSGQDFKQSDIAFILKILMGLSGNNFFIKIYLDTLLLYMRYKAISVFITHWVQVCKYIQK